ncbi:MAG: translation factor SUA5, partial [Oscillospiraceae bacterium]|nr:translation factor SUA5 [Oscillospiraceae bacterium]
RCAHPPGAAGAAPTVACCAADNDVRILRPGFVSKEDIEALTGIGKVICDRGVTERINEGERVMSPGMKYRHYSPKAAVTLIEGSAEALAEFMENTDGNMGGTIDSKVCAMIFDGDEEVFRGKNYITYGYTSEEQARQVFDCLRRVDDEGYEKVYVRSPRRDGVGLAVYNRLLRAAGFEVILL